jgi:Sodium:dicarboxylate symporter family
MSSSTKILVGLLSGVFVGLFLGEHAGVLKIVADGYVKLLQMTVLPYITLSIITSLGALSYEQVKTARAPSRRGSPWPVVSRAGIHVPFSFGLSRCRDGVVFQHHARRTAPAV